MDGLTAFQRDLLYVIAGADRPSGQDVMAELNQYYDEAITHGRLYPNLDTVVEAGLVEKGTRDRRTNYYTITDRGWRQLHQRRAWEAQYVDHVERLAVSIADFGTNE